MTISVAALTSGRFTPSARLRVRQHIRGLGLLGVAVREFVPLIDKYSPVPFVPPTLSPKYILPLFAAWQSVKLATRLPGVVGGWGHDVVWLERQLLSGYLTLEPLLKRPIVFDVDDAIWLARPFGAASVKRTAEMAETVIAGNSYIADWFGRFSKNVHIVPTAVDTDRFRPGASNRYRAQQDFVIGWIGTAGNLAYLEAIENPLSRFLSEHEDASLLVVSEKPPSFKELRGPRSRFVRWTEVEEVDLVQSMDVGLMPLPDNPWTKGKCSFKMLQYMSCGLPVIASPVGMNDTVLQMGEIGISAVEADDWRQALELIHADRELGRKMGVIGRGVVEREFSTKVIVKRLLDIFKGVS